MAEGPLPHVLPVLHKINLARRLGQLPLLIVVVDHQSLVGRPRLAAVVRHPQGHRRRCIAIDHKQREATVGQFGWCRDLAHNARVDRLRRRFGSQAAPGQVHRQITLAVPVVCPERRHKSPSVGGRTQPLVPVVDLVRLIPRDQLHFRKTASAIFRNQQPRSVPGRRWIIKLFEALKGQSKCPLRRGNQRPRQRAPRQPGRGQLPPLTPRLAPVGRFTRQLLASQQPLGHRVEQGSLWFAAVKPRGRQQPPPWFRLDQFGPGQRSRSARKGCRKAIHQRGELPLPRPPPTQPQARVNSMLRRPQLESRNHISAAVHKQAREGGHPVARGRLGWDEHGPLIDHSHQITFWKMSQAEGRR